MKFFNLFLIFCFVKYSSADNDDTTDPALPAALDLNEYADCSEVQQKGHRSGAYDIRPIGSPNKYSVYCNFEFDGQPWTVIQQRYNGQLNFHKTFKEYSEGFGSALGENWAGLEFINQLTRSKEYELYVELTDFDNAKRFGNYKTFSIDSKETGYRLVVGNYSGNAGDSLISHNARRFSTYDVHFVTNDYTFQGGWWHRDELNECNLNGPYLYGATDVNGAGIFWRTWRGYKYSLKASRMMIKPVVKVDKPVQNYNFTELEERLKLQMENAIQKQTTEINSKFTKLETMLNQMMEQNKESAEALQSLIQKIEETNKVCTNASLCKEIIYPEDCSNVTGSYSGVYKIKPVGVKKPFDVYCDFSLMHQQWTVFQKRSTGKVGFYGTFSNYQYGFGNLAGEHWLGLEKLYQIQKSGNYELYIHLTDDDNVDKFARYGTFSISSQEDGYRLSISNYSGTAGDSLITHNGMKFSTYDRDLDIDANRNCAMVYKGAWWYAKCHTSNLNGHYGNKETGVGINWNTYKGYNYSLKITKMMIRRKELFK